MVQPGSVSAPEGGMSGDSPCRDGDSQRGHWDRQWLGSSTSPEPWVTSPGMAANLSKSALALPAPHCREKEPGEKLQRPGNGGAEPAPASPQLCLSPSITGPGSLPSWQCQERDHPGPRWFLGERGCLEQEARGLGQGWDPMGATGLHGGHRQPPAPSLSTIQGGGSSGICKDGNLGRRSIGPHHPSSPRLQHPRGSANLTSDLLLPSSAGRSWVGAQGCAAAARSCQFFMALHL